MKTELTVEQSAKLIELGVPDSKASDLKEWCATSVQCNYCHSIDDNTYFRYNQTLTDKLNSNGFQQEDTSASI